MADLHVLPAPPLSQRHCRVRGKREGIFHVVERRREDGAMDWYTWHWTKRGAINACELYLRTGEIKGYRP